jgi:Uma2 family endonuclease
MRAQQQRAPWNEPLRKLFTASEYHTMLRAGILKEDERVELIEGEILQMPAMGSRHVSGVIRATRALAALHDRADISVQNAVHLDDLSEPQPDLAVLRRRPDVYAEHLPTAQDILLLIEVADTSAGYDRKVKINGLYAHNSVPEAWLISLRSTTLEVYRDPSPHGYRDVKILRQGESLSPLAFPDLAIEVDALLG